MELLTVNKLQFCLEMGIEGLRISCTPSGQPPAEMISGAECQSAFVNDSGSPFLSLLLPLYATFIKINICRRYLRRDAKVEHPAKEADALNSQEECWFSRGQDQTRWGRERCVQPLLSFSLFYYLVPHPLFH